MTEQLFLRRVELSNFRVYGEDFSLSLPDGPGVTLISGPNGMGKTTFFDSIEWGLTGEIKRFAPFLGRRSQNEHLTRLGADEQSHRVSLYFSEGDPIDRTAEYGLSADDIADRLKTPSWPEISDLYSYLSITHFLGQSSEQRFSVKKPSEQWQALRGPAGVDRLNWAKDRMGSQATRMAFTRVIRESTSDLEIAKTTLNEWRQLITRRGSTKKLASISPMSPEEVILEMETLERDFALVVTDDDLPGVTALEISSRIEGFRQKLLEVSERLSRRARLLAELEILPTEAAVLRSQLISVGEQIIACETEFGELQATITALLDRAGKNEKELARKKVELRELRLEQEALASIQIAFDTIAQSEIALLKLSGQFLEIEESIKKQESERESVLTARSNRIASLQRRDSLAIELKSIGDSISVLERYRAGASDLSAFRLANVGSSTVQVLNAEAETDRSQISEIERRTVDIREELNSLNTRESAIASAVAVIASHLHADDKDCPVCGTGFEPGMLIVLAREAKVGRAALVTALTTEIQRLEERKAQVLSHIAELQQRQSEVELIDRTLQAKEDSVRETGFLVSSLGLDLSEIDAEFSRLHSGAAALEQESRQLEGSIVSIVDSGEIESKLAAVVSALSLADSRRASLNLEKEQLQARKDAADSLIRRQTDRLRDQGLDINRWKEYLESSIVQSTSRAEEVGHLEGVTEFQQSELATARNSLGTTERKLSVFVEDQKGLHLRSSKLEDRWTNSGLPLPPEVRSVLREQGSVRLLISSTESILMRLNMLSEGYRSWLEDSELRSVTDEIALRMKASGLANEDAFDARLQKRIAEVSSRLEQASRVRLLSEQLVHSLQEKADVYAEQVLRPLNRCIRQFSRALMTRADDSVSYRAEHYANRSELKPEINLRSGIGGLSSLEMNPNLYFSEGQLAAQSVSALFAASTCFRWSRWRALLLDDPLQHSDVIHASAFVDVVVNLVRELKYQIIISTHDDAEFNYMTRKLASASVPLSLCELRIKGGIGRPGAFVESDREITL